jgi:membrane protein YdbS with pleckstrin-like domain
MSDASDVVWTPLSPTLKRMRLTEVVVVGAVLAVIAGSSALSAGSSFAAVVSIVAIALCSGAAWWFVRNRFRAWGYLERDEDLEVRRGVMVQRLSVVPYGRMQFVEITTGPVERLFGLATVKLHTAAAASDARIPGLHPDEAARLRDRLAALGEAKAAGL